MIHKQGETGLFYLSSTKTPVPIASPTEEKEVSNPVTQWTTQQVAAANELIREGMPPLEAIKRVDDLMRKRRNN